MAANGDRVERIYELAPMQEAMLFASLYAPDSGAYLVQMALQLAGRLDLAALERAWRELVARHAVLRTSFHWEELARPVQVVHAEAELEIHRESWRGLENEEARLQGFLGADRARGFDLGAPPLLRVALIDLAEERWQLVWTMHHIVADGWSRALLLSELFASYAAFAAGREPQLPRPTPYEDYVLWLQRRDPGPTEAFWRRRLAGLAAPTPLAGAAGRDPGELGVRPSEPGVRQARRWGRRLPAGETAAVVELGRRRHLTLNTLIQGAWALLLARATGASDVVFGATVSGRLHGPAGIASAVGLFINTLPVRVAVDPAARLLPWLAALQERQAEASEHETAPLAEVQGWSELPPGTPLFDHLLVLENYPADAALAALVPEISMSGLAVDERTGYPLSVAIFPRPELRFELVYDEARFAAPDAARLAELLAGLLVAFASLPEASLGDLPLLLPGERQQILVEWNDTRGAYPRDASLMELFAAVVDGAPDAPALVAAERVWTYGGLARASRRLAGALAALGVGPGSTVGVAAARSPELILGILGVLQTGAAYLPLDAEYPGERLDFMLADSGAEVALADAASRPRLEGRARLVPLDGWGAGAGAERPAVRVPAEALAYVIYTSGSTGLPKGVAVPQRAVVRLVRDTDYLRLERGDRVAFVSSASFDAATFEIWGALLNGAILAIVPQEVALAPAEFAAFVARHELTVLHLTTALFQQVARDAPEAFAPLRALLFGGEAGEAGTVARLLAAGRVAELVHCYGPTESTTFASCQRLRETPPGARGIPVGRPIRNTTVWLLDRWMRPVPAAAAGEIYIGGDGLAWGYWRRPELTADRFLPSPWGRGERLYRTGDLACRRQDGALEFLGRIDRQVKIRGFRVEPGEVESSLLAHPAVRGAAVLARETEGGERRLIAWVAAAPESGLTGAALRSWLRERSPEHLVPSTCLLLPALPLTPNGKVDYGALPEAGAADPAGEPAASLPADAVEDLLAGIWADVLGRERVGTGDDFFALGGHSLLATRIASRVRSALGVELPVRRLFERPTVAALAETVRAELAGERPEAPPLRPVPRGEAPSPLSFAQQRLWFIDQLEPGNPGYNIAAVLRLAGDLSVPRLAWALAEIVRRHEVLRTTFAGRDGQPAQVVHPARRLALPTVDLSALSGERRESAARGLARAAALLPFDLEAGPLVRVGLLRLAARQHLLLVTLHHIVSDGWSLGVMAREVQALYGAAGRGEPAPLEELPIQYADFAVWQRELLSGEVLAGHLAYWRQRLQGSRGVLELPTDRARPPMFSLRGAEPRFALGRQTSQRVAALARREGSTPYMVLAATVLALLARLSGENDLNLASPIAGRNRLETEGLIGCFVNTLVLRADVAGAASFVDLLQQVREASLGAYMHQDLPFERLIEEIQLERDLSRTPLAQVALAVQNVGLPETDFDGLRMTSEDPPSQVAKFDLAFVLAEDREGCLAGSLQYATDLWDETTPLRIVRQFACLLDAAASDAEAPLADLSYLTAGERQQVLAEWNDTQATAGRRVMLHQLFEEQAAARPAAPAAVFEGSTRSYAELEGDANRCANLLVRLGCRRGTPVAIWMERSLHLPAAVLAVLKAGGTYVPVEPSWPAERAETVLATTRAPIALVSRATLSVAEELRWRLPCLGDLVCLDVATAEAEPEAVDADGVRSLWDFVTEKADDRIAAGGFLSGFTGLPFTDREVDEYRDRVLAVAGPWLRPGARVLEVGCGAGLILWEMARRAERVVGLDPSPATQERNRERCRAEGIANVELAVGFADEIGGRYAAGSFDLVVLASTIHFFPGPRYLERVIAEALGLLAAGGALLLADVPDARREGELRRALAAAGAPAKRGARELWLDEDLFRDLGRALAGAGEVEILHRTAGFANELGFRYEVLLHRGDAPAPGGERRKRLWTGWHAARQASARPAVAGSPEDVAYIIHTSGSTGAPKGIAVQHAPAVHLLGWINAAFGVGAGDRMLLVAALGFDLSVYDIFGLLAAGGSLQVVSEAALGDPERLVRVLCDEPVTMWDSAPAALQQLAPFFPPAADRPLRLVLLSGDWIPVSLPDAVRAAFPRAEVMALGGATEATVWSNAYRVREVDPRWASIPYGRPITGARYHVLDGGMQPCPIGVAGDLFIGGRCLCVGYAGQPDLTARQFVPDPYAPPGEPGARLYRTGDRARFFRDGNLEFLGRSDQQVKVRGYRVELGEIEVALLRHPAVREAVVTALGGPSADRRLVAYVVPREAPPAARELRAWLRESLPYYMVPTAYVTLESLPVTANGKLDRQRLPDPERDHAEVGAYTPPAGPREELLADLFADLLQLDRVGVHDNFFALGGHSLLATQLVSRVRVVLGVELPLQDLFANPTVADLARITLAVTAGSAAARPLVAAAREGPPPLSFAQQRLWFLDRLAPGNPAYNVPWAAAIAGDLDAARLERAFAEVVRRHEALRTTLVEVDGAGPVQVIAESGSPSIPVVDLEGLPAAAAEEEAARLAEEEAFAPFDLARGALLRVTLLRLGPAEHALLVTLHHVIADGWSMGVLLREVTGYYDAWGRGEALRLPALPIQYADFAIWQRDWLRGEVLERQLAFWRERLASAPRRLELATDRPRPAAPSHRGGLLARSLAPDLAQALAGHARREGATLFMSLLACFAVLLGRSASQGDVLVGTPIANRNRREVEGLIGFFVNTLVLRLDLQGSPSFRQLLQRVRREALGAYDHQDLPFERLVEELAGERSADRSPLFQAMLTLQNIPAPPLAATGLTIRPLAPRRAVAKHDLTLVFTGAADGLAGLLEYDAELFDRTTAERLVARLEALLRGALAQPDRPVWDLPFLLAGEREELRVEWNDTWSEPPPEPSIHSRFAAWAAARPEALAVGGEGEEWSYGRLEETANRLARHLRALGVGPESRVGVAMERSADPILAFLAVLKAGGAYLPLDPGYPDERLRLMLADAGAAVVVVHGRTRERFAELAGSAGAGPEHLVCLDEHWPAIAEASAEPLPATSAEQLAYVVYTSGSTGQPKGVAVPHRAVLRLVCDTDYAQLGPRDRVAHVSNLSFDAATFEVWGPLLNGGAVLLMDRDLVLSPAAFAVALREREVSAAFLTTALFNLVVREAPAAFYPLRHLLFGGEAVDPAAVARALDEGPPERLVHVYGPTESTTFAAWYEVRDLAAEAWTVPIGSPVANTTAYVLDGRLDLVPLGSAGELYLGGRGVARGYLGHPELTAERFVPDPLASAPGGRLYRTGDLVRRRADGAIEFLSRLDQQVKIRGFRIEPGEVETFLAGCPGVAECAVLARRDGPGDAVLAAYVVPAAGAGVRETALREQLARLLPEYMRPSDYLFLDSFPLTPNGKIDRAALPPPGAARAVAGRVAPQGPIEELLTGIWEELLGRVGVGVEDDFFALGGHSLMATQVASRLRDAFEVEIPLYELFGRPTIAALAAEVRALLRGPFLAGIPPLRPRERDGDPPLSLAQEHLWIEAQGRPAHPDVPLLWTMPLDGELSVAALGLALDEVAARHEALRSRFEPGPDGPLLRPWEPCPLPLPVLSVEELEDGAAPLAVERALGAMVSTPFDLVRGPLLRAALLRLAPRHHLLAVAVHRAVCDDRSAELLRREIAILVEAYSRGNASPLPPPALRYSDFAAWQRQWLQGEVLEELLSYWVPQVAGASALARLAARRGVAAPPDRRRGRRLAPDLAGGLAALGRRAGATLPMVLLAAFEVLVGRLGDGESFLVGTTVAGRDADGLEDLVGRFANLLALRADLAGDPTFRELLGRVRRAVVGAHLHQELPYELLVDRLRRDGAGEPPIQAAFAFVAGGASERETAGAELAPPAGGWAPSAFPFDLALEVAEEAGGLLATLAHRAEMFASETVDRWLAALEAVLAAVVVNPEVRLSELREILAAAGGEDLPAHETAARLAGKSKFSRLKRRGAQAAEAVSGLSEPASSGAGEASG